MEEMRPNSEQLLRRLKYEEEQKQTTRGKLKIFLGYAAGFRVIIVTVANSLGNIRVFELLPKLKTKKYGWCIA